MIRLLCFLVGSTLLFPPPPLRADERKPNDVVIYGGTPGGISAAVIAGREGRSVLLVEPTSRIGGLTTNGLSHTDFHTFEGLNGRFLEFSKRVHEYYRNEYGANSPQAKASYYGTHGEPHVNELIFERMLAELDNVRIVKQSRLVEVNTTETEGKRFRIASITVEDAEGSRTVHAGRVFIDATYEGDLLAKAGVPYRIGREARSEFKETLAPETADERVQGYNFRLILTQEPENRLPPYRPDGYDRDEFTALLPMLEANKFDAVFVRWSGGIYKAHKPVLPNGKYDINDVSRGIVRLSLPQFNNDYPDGDPKTREAIVDRHRRHNLGLLYFLQTDPAVPEKYRTEALTWGHCRDEFESTDGIPEQLYIREARRMEGLRIFTENDTDAAPDGVRAKLHTDAIAVGDYGLNCHGTDHEGPTIGGRHTGEFYRAIAPYQIPLGTILPKHAENLIAPVPVSASHVGFCALRLEPIWVSLGEAAGIVAHLAIKEDNRVQSVSVTKVQRLLHGHGATTIYVTDVPVGSDDFAAVQWWGTRGGLHGLHEPTGSYGKRGPKLTSQYFKAYPGHTAELDQPLDAETRTRWMTLAKSIGLPADATQDLSKARTRGEFIRAAYRLWEQSQER